MASITFKQAADIAKAAFANKSAFGMFDLSILHAVADAGHFIPASAVPDGSDTKSVTALTNWLRKNVVHA